MKDMFNVSDLIMAEETGLEVVRSMPKSVPEKKNDIYMIAEIPLTVEHDCHGIDIDTFCDKATFLRIGVSTSSYLYRINHGDWISVGAGRTVIEEDFDIASMDIRNDVGTGTIQVYLEGVLKDNKVI